MDCPLCSREMNVVVHDLWYTCLYCAGKLWYVISSEAPPYWEHYGKEYSQQEFERYLKLKAFW
jgi:hypothetical protein